MFIADPTENIKKLYLKENHIVVDLGAGSGMYTRAAAARVPQGKVYALEVQKEIMERLKSDLAREGITNVECLWADIELRGGTKLRDALADDAIVSNVLFQIEDKVGFAREVARIMKPGGKVMVIDWTGTGGFGPSASHIVKKSEAVALFENVGFKKEEEFDAGDNHYGIIFVK